MHYDLIVENAMILSSNFDYKAFVGHVAVLDGFIVKVQKETIDTDEAVMRLDASDKILMPGLFNCHCHGDMTLARGLGDDLTLAEQNEVYGDSTWFKRYINDDDRYVSRQLTYIEALMSGTTFMVENMYWSLGLKGIDAMHETGIKGALVEDVLVDFMDPYGLQDLEYLKEFKEKCLALGLVPMLGSVSEENFDLEILNNIEKLVNDSGLPKTLHLAENTWRVKLVQDKQGTTPVDYLYKNNFLTKQTLGSHVVYVSEQEINQFKETGASVVNTPTCEMKIDDGIAPIATMINSGVNVCLGSDGAMWNNSNDIFREMRNTALYQTSKFGIRSISKESILDMATLNGAKAMGLEKEYGSIEEGKKASFILIDTMQAHMRPLSLDSLASRVIFSVSGQDVTDVFVDGKHTIKNKELQSLDLKDIIKKNDLIYKKIQTQLEKRGKKNEKI